MSFKVLEGVPIPRQGGWEIDQWRFEFGTWTSPFYLEVTAEHPDGPSGFKHEHFVGREELQGHYFATKAEAEAEGRKWTPERRRQYLAHDPIRWSGVNDAAWEIRGALTPAGRKRFHRVYKKDGYPFAPMSLRPEDFRNGITTEMLEWMVHYRLVGQIRGRATGDEWERRRHQEILDLEARLDKVPEPLLRHYRMYRAMYEEGWKERLKPEAE